VPVPANAVTGVTETAAFWNAQVRDAVNFLLNPPEMTAYQSSAQTIPTGVATAVTLDVNVIDSYGGHSTVTNNTRYVAQVSGFYTCAGIAAFSPNATGVRTVSLQVNGTTGVPASQAIFQAVTSAGINTNVPTRTMDVFLNAGDYIELMATQTSGGNLALQTGGINTSGLWVSWRHT
jgi:hypothetical protein